MVFYQFQQAGNKEYQSWKKWNNAGWKQGNWNSSRRKPMEQSRRRENSEFRYAQFFAIIAKVTVHSENQKFLYAQIFAKLVKFR